MRLLAVNPNTSQAVTDRFVAEARRVAPPGVTIDGVTGRFGVRIVTTEAGNVVAGHSALDLIARHAAGHDGVILAISFDSALAAARELLTVPVVALTESALAAATAPVGVILFGSVSRPIYERLIAGYGVTPLGIEVIESTSIAAFLEAGASDRPVVEAVERLAAKGARSAVICGAAVVGMAARLAPSAPIPLVDGSAAVAACLARIGSRRQPVPAGESVGLSPELAALLRGGQ